MSNIFLQFPYIHIYNNTFFQYWSTQKIDVDNYICIYTYVTTVNYGGANCNHTLFWIGYKKLMLYETRKTKSQTKPMLYVVAVYCCVYAKNNSSSLSAAPGPSIVVSRYLGAERFKFWDSFHILICETRFNMI